MTKQDLINWATGKGWTMDRFGHMKKVENGKEWRIKLQDRSWRLEVAYPGHDGKRWFKKANNYYSKTCVNENGKLSLIKD